MTLTHDASPCHLCSVPRLRLHLCGVLPLVLRGASRPGRNGHGPVCRLKPSRHTAAPRRSHGRKLEPKWMSILPQALHRSIWCTKTCHFYDRSHSRQNRIYINGGLFCRKRLINSICTQEHVILMNFFKIYT